MATPSVGDSLTLCQMELEPTEMETIPFTIPATEKVAKIYWSKEINMPDQKPQVRVIVLTDCADPLKNNMTKQITDLFHECMTLSMYRFARITKITSQGMNKNVCTRELSPPIINMLSYYDVTNPDLFVNKLNELSQMPPSGENPCIWRCAPAVTPIGNIKLSKK